MRGNSGRIAAALTYVARGWLVIPCAPHGKAPLTARGLKDGTTNAETIREWWCRWPGANVAIVAGRASGFFVLDIDGQDGEEFLARLEGEHGPLPKTVEGHTGGGRHLFFTHPGEALRNSARRLGAGLDVRADGGYVIAPPSIHPTGRPYIWLPGRAPNETPLAAAPAWLLHRIREPVGSKPAPRGNGNPGIGTAYAQAALARELARLARAPIGTRNDQLNRSAFALGQLVGAGVLDRGLVENALGALAREIGLEPVEVERTLASGLSSGIAEPRDELVVPAAASALKDKLGISIPPERIQRVPSGCDDEPAAAASDEMIKEVLDSGLVQGDKVAVTEVSLGSQEAPAPVGAATASEVDGEGLVADVEKFISSYVVLPPQTSLPLAAWTLATYCYDSFDAFAYLLVVSPAPRCGKTRLLEVLSLIVSTPRRTANISESALFRVIEKFSPTLLMDEMENLRGRGERSEYLRGLINAGNRRDATVTRCVGKDFDPKEFSVFCPKVISGLGHFPHTIKDRSIVVGMQRRKAEEKLRRFIFREARPVGEELRRRAQMFIESERQQVERAYTSLDLQFLEDRDAEAWEPLFALLGVADPSRVAELRTYAEQLCKGKADADADDNLAIRLLFDLRDIWPHDQPNILTSELLGLLRGIEEAPWASEVDLNPRKLARFLKGFDVKSKSVRVGDRAAKGYAVEDLKASFRRYLPSDGLERSRRSQRA